MDLLGSGHAGPASHRLPIELVRQICIVAAEKDRHCAHTLAFVSRAICQWTATARWKTVALTSVRQYLAFVRVINCISDSTVHAYVSALRQFFDFESLQDVPTHFDPGKHGATNLQRLSLPEQGEAHAYIRHLLIDPRDSPSGLHLLSTLHIRVRARLEREAISRPEYDLFGVTTFFKPWERTSLGLSLDHLSIGAGGLYLVNALPEKHLLKELTVVYTSDEGPLWDDMLPHSQMERLHIIGIDGKSSRSGEEPPWHLLTRLGSSGPDHAPSQHQLTHLRYDTRKFSFKPAEIFASRLRPLLQEVTIKPDSSTTSNGTSALAPAGYQHSGPRHAAPAKGAGNAHTTSRSSLTPVQHLPDSEAAGVLRERVLVGHLDFLQFAWEPMANDEKRAEDVPWSERVRFSNGKSSDTAAADTGGWPREVRGAWTERSDRDLAPSFAVELRDAINSLYGWDAPGIEAAGKFVARRDCLPDNQQQNCLRNIAFSPDRAGELVERIKDGFKPVDKDNLHRMAALLDQPAPTLQYGVRAPRSLVHLGGRVPFERQDRLALFEDRARGGKGAWP